MEKKEKEEEKLKILANKMKKTEKKMKWTKNESL